MSRPLPYHVHAAGDAEPLGAFAYAEDAALFVASLGDGAQVTYFGGLVWHEGHEAQSAGESYDDAADVMNRRARQSNEAFVAAMGKAS